MADTHAEQQKKPTTQRQSTRRAPAPSTVAPQRGPVSMRQLIQRALDDPSSVTAVDGAHLQRSIGNRAVGQILAASAAKRTANFGAPAIQTKLALGPAGDKYEQEADRTAKQVMRSLNAPAAQADTAPNESILIKTILFDDQVTGYVTSHRWFGEPEVSYWLGKEYWGRGIATQALAQFLRQQPVRPLYARAVKDNVASLRVLEKCGFVVCGEDKGFANARGEEVEELILSLR